MKVSLDSWVTACRSNDPAAEIRKLFDEQQVEPPASLDTIVTKAKAEVSVSELGGRIHQRLREIGYSVSFIQSEF